MSHEMEIPSESESEISEPDNVSEQNNGVKKRSSYCVDFKQKVICYMDKRNSIDEAVKKFKIERQIISRWKKQHQHSLRHQPQHRLHHQPQHRLHRQQHHREN
ncbi:unnamed protein product [Brachionus calyciflorus]|uniref:Transposase Synechocystis PCC 6803 domain-containing protein n=1 Tax=Brachionus calyciflorus TaxID=104777 RepID=A0A813U155_9BILA|nr:unnamed protein product [Brachionus calyciflorus]